MSMKNLGILLIASSVMLSACGSRTDESVSDGIGQIDGNGNPIDPNSPSLGAALPDTLDVRIVSDVNSIETGGTEVANITAYVLDEDNNAISGQAITFRSSGGVLQNVDGTTNENGEASAVLRLLQDFRRQDITVTAQADTFSAEVLIAATGSELTVSGPDQVAFGSDVELNITLIAGDEEAISNQEITIVSAAGNLITPSTVTTDPDGRATVVVNSDNGSDTISVQALDGTVEKTHGFVLTENLLSFPLSTYNAELPVALSNDIEVTWTRNNQPVVGELLRFSITAGQITSASTVLTDSEGQATITITSSSAGSAEINVQGINDLAANTKLDVEFVAINPATLTLSGSPTRVDTAGTSEIKARVVDVNGNPVKNRSVNFTSADLRGGQLSPASATTDSDGLARVYFTAGNNPTEIDDIEIVAEVVGTAINDNLPMTVVKRVLNITIGTSNEILVKPLGTQYAMPFIVQVADGSGKPLEAAQVELSIRPIWYGKGHMTLASANGIEFADALDPNAWVATHWRRAASSINCVSEDVNGNRVLDAGEDINGNGTLDPQDPSALTAVDGGDYATINGGVLETDKNGSGFFELLYPASNSDWGRVEITARAQDLGAEAEDSFVTTLRLPGSESNDVINEPANAFSPYGLVPDCTTTN